MKSPLANFTPPGISSRPELSGKDFRPAPKHKRVVDQDMRRWVVQRRDGICMIGLARPEYGPCIQGLHGHHIETRGSGGDDTKENLITLCPKHHDLAHARKITIKELHEILNERFGYDI